MSTRLHENPLIAATRAMVRTRDKADGKGDKSTGARLVLNKISSNDILTKTNTIFGAARNTLIRKSENRFIDGVIVPYVKTAFTQSRTNAWHTILRTPGGISARDKAFIKKYRRVIRDTEKAAIVTRLEPLALKLQALNKAAINDLTVSIANMRAAGMPDDKIRAVIEADWNSENSNGNPSGRITGTYKRGFITIAREMVTIADKVGQEAGYFDIGGWRDVI